MSEESGTRTEGSPVAKVFERSREAVLDDRGETHGGIEDNFSQTASLWNVYLGDDVVSPRDVAMMMVLTKVSRQCCGSTYHDHYDDIAGYAAIANGLARLEEEDG